MRLTQASQRSTLGLGETRAPLSTRSPLQSDAREEMNDVRKSNSARKGVHRMKKLLLVSFALALVVSLLALAQETTKSGALKQETTKAEKMSAKAVAVSGTVSAAGKTFVDKENKSWTVTNPEALKGHEGHEVTLTAHVDAAKNEVHVVSVKMGKSQMKDATKKDEMKK